MTLQPLGGIIKRSFEPVMEIEIPGMGQTSLDTFLTPRASLLIPDSLTLRQTDIRVWVSFLTAAEMHVDTSARMQLHPPRLTCDRMEDEALTQMLEAC